MPEGSPEGRPERSGLRLGAENFRLQCLFVERLVRLAKLRAVCLGQEEHPALKLLDHALYSTYRDCVGLGLGAQAREIVQMGGKRTRQAASSERESFDVDRA